MAIKIMIDPGHGGYDSGATFEDRKEKDEVLQLALAVGEILQAQGYDIEYTRTTDVYDSPVQKARIANASGADFFVSIHRNSSPTPNQYHGVQTLIYDDSGIKKIMAENINKELEKVGYRNINVDIRPDLAVLRRTNMPAVLVEAGFINSDIDNNLWDTKFNETAEAIARGIDETIRAAGLASNTAGQSKMVNAHYGYESSVPVFTDRDDDMMDDDMDDMDDDMNNGMGNNMNGGMNNMPGNNMNGGMNNMPGNNMNGGMNNMPGNNMNDGMNNMPGNNMNGGMNNMPGNNMNGGMNNMPGNNMNSNMNNMTMNNTNENQGFQILIGIYRSFGSASYQMNRLINEGYFAEIYEEAGLYQVRVGEYDNVEEALIAQRELRDRGYETLIVRNVA